MNNPGQLESWQDNSSVEAQVKDRCEIPGAAVSLEHTEMGCGFQSRIRRISESQADFNITGGLLLLLLLLHLLYS